METNKLVHGEAYSPQKFKNPSREFGIMPFWFWNGELNYDEMEYQLKEYADKGVSGIYIHSRFGHKDHVPYLSDDWFDRCKFTVDKAQDLGIQVWVYDEYNWPSGTADQQIQKDNPDLTQRYLELVVSDVAGQFFTFMEGTDSRYNDLERSEPIYACAILNKDLEAGNFEFVDLMPSLSFDKVITWEAPPGPWKLLYFIERRADWYTDVLNEETTKIFLEKTHERYKESLGERHFSHIKGFYTDEPAMHYFEVGRDNFIIPWSKNMFRIFKEHNGYNLRHLLPQLFFEVGEDPEQVRFDFWSALTDQYEKSFYKPISDWCEDNDQVFTGHLLYEESLRLHARTGGNLFKHLRHFDMTGVDHLYPRIGTREMPNEHVALKIASSAAHQNRSTRLLCESMGGAYWDCTMERMKWIADWEYVLGVNIFNPHGFHYSIEGERKRDWPPSQFYHHTWWEQYKLFNSYMTRLGYMLSGGRHVAKVAVLYPMNSIWATYTPQEPTAIGKLIESEFEYITDRLLRLHIDFDYIDEDVLVESVIENGKIKVADEEYEMVILTGATHLKAKTLDAFERFVDSGGGIVADTLLPYKCIEGECDDFKERIEKLFGLNPDEINERFLSGNAKKDFVKGPEDKTVFIGGNGLHFDDDMAILDKAVRTFVTPEIEIDNDEVFYLHRVKDEKDVIFIINPIGEASNVTVKIEGEFTPQLMNLENGDINDISVFWFKDGKTCFVLHMDNYGSALVSISPLKENSIVKSSDITVTEIDGNILTGYGRLEDDGKIVVQEEGKDKVVEVKKILPKNELSLDNNWNFSVNAPNAYLTDAWKVAIEKEPGDPVTYCSGDFEFSNWMDFRMGCWEMQLLEEWDEKDYPANLWFVTSFNAKYISDDLKVMIDGFKGSAYEIYVNGKKVETPEVRSFIDAEIKERDIAEFAKLGVNKVAVKLTVNKKSDGMLDLLKIIGTFSLEKDGNDFTIVEPVTEMKLGSWTDKGYPYFSGTGTFTQIIDVPKDFEDKIIMLNAELGADVLEVRIDGELVGTRLWRPYTMDLTKYLKYGKREISISVVNTLINFLKAEIQPSGLFEIKIVPYDKYEVIL